MNAEEEGDTPSMRELVEVIDSHMELVDLEITSNLDALPRSAPSSTPDPAAHPFEDAQAERAADTVDDPVA